MMSTQALRDRTDAKLRYAQIYLEALNDLPQPLGGSDVERAHAESFLFHLIGAKDCFWHELTALAGHHPLPVGVRVTQLRNYLSTKKVVIQEIEEMHRLAADETSWLHHASEMRHIGIHDRGVSRAFNLGGPMHQKVQLRIPTTNALTDHYPDVFEGWLGKMRALIEQHRLTAPTISTP